MKDKLFNMVFILLASILVCYGLFIFFKEEDDLMNENNNNKVFEVLSGLTLDEKIAQMVIISFSETEMSQELRDILEYKPSGIILFKDNITTYDKTYQLINDIKDTADIPMFISIDQEGGRVVRIEDLGDVKFSKLPTMQKVGNLNDKNLTYELGKVIAEELLTLGINVDFAPVIDVIDDSKNNSVIGDRSFGIDYQVVSSLGIALANGLGDNGVIPVYKHFPGHGSTKLDSHKVLPIVSKTKEDLWQKDLLPFEAAISNNAEIIMIGHLAVPSISGNNIPASLSKEIITDLLKNEMNYNGLVITDALNMKAITNNYTEKEIYELAINAGVDLLLMPNSLESAITLIKELINENKVTEEQINDSVYKILKLKYENLSTTTLDKSYIASDEHLEVINSFN